MNHFDLPLFYHKGDSKSITFEKEIDNMPTNKNKMQYLLDDTYYLKFNALCKKLKRKSASDMTKYIVEKFIDDYEEIHGEIKVEE